MRGQVWEKYLSPITLKLLDITQSSKTRDTSHKLTAAVIDMPNSITEDLFLMPLDLKSPEALENFCETPLV